MLAIKERGRAHAAHHAPTIPTTTTLTYSVQCDEDDDDDQCVYKRANHSRIKHHQIFYHFYRLFLSLCKQGVIGYFTTSMVFQLTRLLIGWENKTVREEDDREELILKLDIWVQVWCYTGGGRT